MSSPGRCGAVAAAGISAAALLLLPLLQRPPAGADSWPETPAPAPEVAPECVGGPAVVCADAARAGRCGVTDLCAAAPASAVASGPGGRASRRHWYPTQAGLARDASAAGGAKLVLYGDSIVEALRGTEQGRATASPHLHLTPELFRRAAGTAAVALGMAGDPTQHLLWRLVHGGEAKGVQPDAAVVLAGTNNLGLMRQSPADTAAGVLSCAAALCALLPSARVFVSAVLPRADCQNRQWSPCTPGVVWQNVVLTNAELRKAVTGGHPYLVGCAGRVSFMDCTSAMLMPGSTDAMDPSASADAIHPNATGWRRLWRCMRSRLRNGGAAAAADSIQDMA
eukprot:TRINITY_DN8052_c2_g1_i1.p2 TRINITY_DN8052_c2_g1~~TRINITY_DN8052_c2_g1_i1.p2  ORF type:complete len:338 (+),score=95.37 TRINITY_DN8052_c2_g1_i1:29-1042(+)